MRRGAVLVFAVALVLGTEVCLGGTPKAVDPSDPSVVAAKTFFEEELNAKFNQTKHEVVHFCDSQRQVVNGMNFWFTVVVKATTEEDDGETGFDWVMHKAKVYEHPAWDTSATEKYELTLDEVPLYEDAFLDLPEAAKDFVVRSLSAALPDASDVSATSIMRHTEQRIDVEYFSMMDGKSVEEAVNHRVYGTFALDGETEAYVDVAFVTKGEDFIYFDHVLGGSVDSSGDGGEDPGAGPAAAKDVKLLTMKTSMVAIFLVGLVTCGILLVHFFRRRHKRSKEDWYIEQLTDIDEL